jgi:UDP:flavonoid glycosyltransferase YjiC (YdhE family)
LLGCFTIDKKATSSKTLIYDVTLNIGFYFGRIDWQRKHRDRHDSLEILKNLLDRPIVNVTQGTISNDPNQLLMPTFEALADENVSVIATTSNRSLTDLDLSALPSNARVEQFIAYPQLLPQVNVMITNGGFQGVQAAPSHGIPLITAGQTEEKPEIGARVA